MKWSTAKPTTPGWYWFKKSDRKPHLVELQDSREGLHGEGFLVAPYTKYWDGLFAGPLEPPKKATKLK